MADEIQSTAQMTPAGQPPQAPEEAHTAVGKLYHSVLGALGGQTNTDYQPDPETGEVKPVVTPKTPGQQWKQIIAGAMTGLAAGAQAKRENPGAPALTGAGKGFEAGAGRSQAQDQQKRNQAQQQLENMDKATLRKAQLAKMNQDRIMWSRDMRNMDVAEASQFETAMGAVDKEMEAAGAQKMPIMVGGKDVNGQPGNADAMMQYFSDPKAHQPPDGYHLVKGQRTDFSGLSKDAKGNWVDKDGKQVELASRTGHYVYAVPDKAMDQMVSIDPAEFKANTGMDIKTQGPVRLKLSAYMAGVQKHVDELSKEHLAAQHEAGETSRAHIAAEGKTDVADINAAAKRAGGEDKAVAAHDKAYVQPAMGVEKSFRMMDNAYNEYQAARKAGKELPTGAQSMLALSTHLATTFGNVKGARVTKDMIHEHLGARSISDDALAAFQKLTNGDRLSPAQWDAFHDLVGESRRLTWEGAVKEAKRKNIPLDFLPSDLQHMTGVSNIHQDQQGNAIGWNGKAWIPVTKHADVWLPTQ